MPARRAQYATDGRRAMTDKVKAQHVGRKAMLYELPLPAVAREAGDLLSAERGVFLMDTSATNSIRATHVNREEWNRRGIGSPPFVRVSRGRTCRNLMVVSCPTRIAASDRKSMLDILGTNRI